MKTTKLPTFNARMSVDRLRSTYNAIAGRRVRGGTKQELILRLEAEMARRRKPGGRSIGEAARELLMREQNGMGLTYEQVLAKLRREFPKSRTSLASLRWYAARLRQTPDIKVPRRRATRH